MDFPRKRMASPSSTPSGPGAHLCVNKRREPTTDPQVTRRRVRAAARREEGGTRALEGTGDGQLSVHWGRLPPRIRHGEPELIGPVNLVSWPEFFACWESSGHIVRPSLREMRAESATGAACRVQAA
ncbi:hypothetical protein FNV62_12240 [Streptomyces sp. RLB3-17]|nr:hypothetical protein FNV67_13920 [Streptomyces sp. S1D4-20]QDN66420.1 hypothetical protein FNV66_13515 [Streptomyces sp. S1D4-14]QDN76707.1 hypothetical protein FNV64_15040 [Streptomyces sp. S1A1-7]QDN86395.1 hypothetical protein FNV61_12975 [Streptomyces sp. RLB3-6]QDN97075.1 hypothetical protein FNV58_14705 [Streptomyces sp. RLB1-9]QDO07208.1 hypothetical protein FNV68_14075 [Streptomyces sp. S1D4-23]QDO18781.1 hypothetical protein FNV65_13150 [Streptomyces sp. S1A1-8]QDO28909.1 hypothe